MLLGMALHPVVGEPLAALLDGVATANSIKSHPRLLPLLTGFALLEPGIKAEGSIQ